MVHFRLFNRTLLRAIATTSVLVTIGACSLKTTPPQEAAATLPDTSMFGAGRDTALAPDDVPFALRLYESLLESAPAHEPLLLSTCSSFTQYTFADVQTEADVVRFDDVNEAGQLDRRALSLYLRARDYCLRAMELRFRGILARLATDPVAALRQASKKDVELLYWTAASWGSAIALAPDRPELLIDFPIVRALAYRALVLDGNWNGGAVHEMLITLESVEALGGSFEKAREHFNRAVALQHGALPGPYVALAAGVSVGTQNRAEFEQLLDRALAIDPEKDPATTTATLVTQRRARALREHADALFSR